MNQQLIDEADVYNEFNNFRHEFEEDELTDDLTEFEDVPQ